MTTAADVIASAKSKLGARYVFGDEGPTTFDCSGLMQWAFGQHGIKLPRISKDQAKVGQTVKWEDRQPGDMIFSTWDGQPDVDHVALYLGNDEYIHAPKAGDVVKISKIGKGYREHVTNVQRVIGAGIPDSGGGGGLPVFPLPGLPSGPVDALAGLADGIRTMATGVVSMGNLAASLSKIFLPSNALRAGTGVLGAVFLFAGIFIIARQVRE